MMTESGTLRWTIIFNGRSYQVSSRFRQRVRIYLSLEDFIKQFTLLQCTWESIYNPALFVSLGLGTSRAADLAL